jgi:hypothetical protein
MRYENVAKQNMQSQQRDEIDSSFYEIDCTALHLTNFRYHYEISDISTDEIDCSFVKIDRKKVYFVSLP